MGFLIVAILIAVIVIILKKVFDMNLKEIKKIAENERLKELTKKYPDNVDICKWYLKKLNNEDVEIEVNESKESCLYIAVTNKILIANIKNTYTRIQTIAHECLHSVQGKKILNFNFGFSNIYLIYFLLITVLALLNILPNKGMFLSILIFLSMTYLLVRNFLENDAMTKAKYLAREYMEDVKISPKEEIDEIVLEFEKINNYGIKGTNYHLYFNVCIKIIVFSLICFVGTVAF